MAYKLSNRSKSMMVGSHPIIPRLVGRAIEISEVDFGVYEGPRTPARQAKLVAAGASRTLDGMHIPQKDLIGGTQLIFSHAVDLVPWIDGQWRWEWGACYKIAVAMHRAATEQMVVDDLCWGGVWDRWMSQYGGSLDEIKGAVGDYTERTIARKKAAGKKPTVFLDGPHFQVGRLG